MLFVVLLFLKLIVIYYSWKNKISKVTIFIFSSIIIDIIINLINLIKSINNYPKPYTGTGFILFCISTIAYLSQGSFMLYFTGKIIKSKTLQHISILFLISISSFILFSYPAYRGQYLLNALYAYYGGCLIISFGSIVAKLGSIKDKYFIDKIIFMMLSLGGIAELILIIMFGYQYYWILNMCNVGFYLIILYVARSIHLYARLLSR